MNTHPPQSTHSPDWKWEFLARAGAILSSSLDYDATLREVTRLAVERLADWCAFDELGSDGRIRRIAVAHPNPKRVALAYELEERYPTDPEAGYGVPQVLRTGEPELVQEIPDEFLVAGARDEEHLRLARELGLKAYFIVPLKTRGKVMGALTLVSAESGRRFGPQEQEVAELLAQRAAVALDHARLFREAEREREAAQASEADVREILEGLGEPLVVYDAEWRFRYVNSAAEAVFAEAGRREPESLLGRDVWKLYPGLVDTQFEREMRRAQREGVAVSFEEHYARSGSWVEIRAYPLPSGGTVAVWKDVTEQKRADEALHYLSESSAILASSLDYHTTLSAVARLMVPQLADWCSVEVLDEHGRLQPLALAHVDPAKVEWARDFTRRYPADPDAGTGAYQVVRTGKPELIENVTEEMLAAATRDEEHLRAARELGLVSAMTVPLTARGHTLGVLSLVAAESGRHYTKDDLSLAMELAQRAAIAVDNARLHRESEEARERLEEQASELEMQAEELQSQATQLEEVQAELEMSNEELRSANDHLSEQTTAAEEARREAESANRAKSAFLANMSHELRTPLNAILGYTDLLEIGVPEPIPAGAHEQVERIGRASRHLLSVIEEILTFSRVDAGRETAEMEGVDLTELTGEVNAIIEPLAAAKGLRFKAPDHLPDGTLCTDPRKLRQILINLLGNAVKFTAEGEVGLEVGFSAENVEFCVRDTGVGIAPEHRESIFEPFRQVDDRRTRSAEGTGLGLAVSRRLARLLGGDVTVSSKPGEGSVFHLTLPRDGSDLGA